MEFQIGDKVKWRSQAGGSWTVKEGCIIAVVPAKKRARDYIPEAYHDCQRMFDGFPRPKKSYLVEVSGGKTAEAKPRLYWPHASKLEKVT